MAELQCPIDGCTYSTPSGLSETVACTLLTAHSTIHMRPTLAPLGPKLQRPKVDVGLSLEEWNVFKRRWDAFVTGSGLDATSCSTQLFQCAGEALGDSLLKSDPAIISKPTAELLTAMKSLAVIAVATGVTRAELMGLGQERNEQFRSFAARVRGKAETCNYQTKCPCTRVVDFTDSIIRDVLIAGIDDGDIRREILGTIDILEKPINDIIALVESKEMARNALPSSGAISSSSYRRLRNKPQGDADGNHHDNKSHPCPDCGKPFQLFTEGKSGLNTKPHRQCIDCYRSNRNRRRQVRKSKPDHEPPTEAGAIFSQIGHYSVTCSSLAPEHSAIQHAQPIHLTHNIFSKGQWRRAQFRDHPTVRLTMTVSSADYRNFGRKSPTIPPTEVTALADSGAQSCLWSLKEFKAAGFTTSDLIPVHINLVAANKSPISIEGAVLVRLEGVSKKGEKFSCATMVYVSKQARGLYISMENMVDLGIISSDFPCIGTYTAPEPETNEYPVRVLNAGCSTPSAENHGCCSCPTRTVVPELPHELPFECTPESIPKMEQWLLHHFASFTFNTCPHRPLPHMTGPPVEIHLKDNAVPKAVHTSASVPIHWMQQVKEDLLRDEALGVIERVPYGEPVTWCHRMVVTRKHDGKPRRTVDLSPLNKHCHRETFASESPFQLARRVPPNTWKTVTDAWNGFHNVPLRESDRHLTTFITPFGRWRYLTTPQGFVGSGDGYNRRFDAILSDFQRKERVTDDTIHYDADLREHWWRTIKFLIRVGQSGIVLNPDKFQFARRTVDFAGFRVSDSTIEPLPKYTDAIRNFPKPKSTTDIRSWFGLVNQVSNYAQLLDTMAPFKPFLSPKCSFQWTAELEDAFKASKNSIIQSIRHGVEIFDPTRRTCLRPDWSRQGIGYFLLRKYCSCHSLIPDCCSDGWRVTLAGSRFLSTTEQRYAPIEGECLAVVWGLEQTKYFTQGCSNLVVVTDHKPLTKILGDRTLDEISNTRIFRLKQRTLLWSFDIAHLPGKTNAAADATSRHPAESNLTSDPDKLEHCMAAAIREDVKESFSLSWDHIADETLNDPFMSYLKMVIENGFQNTPRDIESKLADFWQYRESLHISDGVILYQDRVVIPPPLRNTVLKILHSANQGVSSMESRARAIVFWPGMTKDIRSLRDNCEPCNRNAPSQASTPAAPVTVPSTPFESVFADFFTFSGWHYLVAGDRLSGWVEVYKSPHSTDFAGAKGLIAALRTLFATFGVPEELSSDGGPEFDAEATSTFLKRWGVRHRISSAYFPQSNGRAEVAVKKCKRLLMDNVSPNGSLNNDHFLRALLQIRNTPDPDCNLSPAEIIFGRPIRDAFSFINKLPKYTNPSVRSTWREAWHKKEDALRVRYSRTSERLDAHARPLQQLNAGDQVFIQNQHGRHPTKWDKSGTVIDIQDYDQYIVKVDGSGRLTKRNRRFLRKFNPPSIVITDSYRKPQKPQNIIPPVTNCSRDDPTPSTTIPPPNLTVAVPQNVCPGNPETPENPGTSSPPPLVTVPMRPPTDILSSPAPATSHDRHVSTALDRPRRCTRPPRAYVPETGQWE